MKYNFLSNLTPDFFKDKSVVIRVDFNVPVINGIVQDASRIVQSIPTIDFCRFAKKIILISHFGRPKGINTEFSMKQIQSCVEEKLGKNIDFVTDIVNENTIKNSKSQIVLLENLRFHNEEEENDQNFAKAISDIGDVYINDAFAASHRPHASVFGVAKFTKVYAGLLLEQEISAIDEILLSGGKKFAIIGGSKVSTKIDLLTNLSKNTKTIFLCGGMANTFLYAQGFEVGASLCEKDFREKSLEIIKEARKNGCEILLPNVVITAKKLEKHANIEVKHVSKISSDDMILDIHPSDNLVKTVLEHDVILWNGPLGVFEIPPFNIGTEMFARSIISGKINQKIFIGGGDSVSAIAASGLRNSFDYISTGGGAFLEALEGKILPGIESVLSK